MMNSYVKFNSYSRYEEYIKNCKKRPRSFTEWLVTVSKLHHHREIIRPMIKNIMKKMNKILQALKIKSNRFVDKLVNRLTCVHYEYEDVYCNDTGLFMYKECVNCGKKKCLI